MILIVKKHSLLFIAAFILLIQPFFYNYIIIPRFKNIVIKNAEDEAIRVGNHLKNAIGFSGTHSKHSNEELSSIINDLNIRKIKIFNHTGLITYSTDKKDIGVINTKSYFVNKVMKGEVFTKVVKKHEKTLEGDEFNIDVSETYTPYMKNNKFIGSFEIYYNITNKLNTLEANISFVKMTQYIISIVLALFLLILYRAKSKLYTQHTKVKENFIAELENQVEVKTTELQKSLEELIQASQARSIFISNISHELRTPMHSIMSFTGFAQKAANSSDIEKLDKYLSHIKNASQELLDLIEDMLFLTVLDSGEAKLNLKNSELTHSMRMSVNSLTTLASEAQVNIKTNTKNKEYYSMLDQPIFAKAIDKILSNAVQYSHKGTTVEISFNENQDTNEILIKNCGQPIPYDELRKIFNPFVVGKKTYDGSGGKGMGLAIAQKIVQAHKGNITAESNEDICTFTISLAKVK